MMSNTFDVRILALIASLVTGCGRIGYELIPINTQSSLADGGADTAIDGGAAPDATQFDARYDAMLLDAGHDAAGFDSGARAAPDEHAPACGGEPSDWTFDRDVESWQYEPNGVTDGGLTWRSGTLSLEARSGADGLGGWVGRSAPSDLVERTIYGAVWADGTAPVFAKLYVKVSLPDGTYAWADGGDTYLEPRKWACLALDLNAPVFSSPGFDATLVYYLGFEVRSSAPFSIYFDEVGYR